MTHLIVLQFPLSITIPAISVAAAALNVNWPLCQSLHYITHIWRARFHCCCCCLDWLEKSTGTFWWIGKWKVEDLSKVRQTIVYHIAQALHYYTWYSCCRLTEPLKKYTKKLYSDKLIYFKESCKSFSWLCQDYCSAASFSLASFVAVS